MSPSRAFHPLSRRRHGIPRGFLAALVVLLYGAGGTQPPVGPVLQEGLTLEREIRGGETHVYPVELQQGQFLRVVVQENGIDLAVRLTDPDGKVATGVDSPSYGPYAQEDLAAVARSSGKHRLEVVFSSKPEIVGSYKLAVQSLGETAGERDKIRAEAVRSFWEAYHPLDRAGDKQTVELLAQAQDLWMQIQERRKQAEVLYLLGNTRHRLQGGIERAIEDFRQSALLWKDEIGPDARLWHIDTLYSMGNLLLQIRQPDEARKLFTQAIAMARAAKDLEREAKVLTNLGWLEIEEGESQQGLAYLLLAQERAQEAGTLGPKLLINLGNAYGSLGERQKALQNYEKALDLARSTGDRKHEATALNNLGDTYYSLGDWEAALRYFQSALDFVPVLKDRQSEARSLNNLGLVYLRLGRYEEAGRALDQAGEISRESQDRETETTALIHKAELLRRGQRPDEAFEIGLQALSLASGIWTAEADARQLLGIASREMGDLRTARKELKQAVDLARSRGDIDREAYYMLSQARTERAGGDLQAALSLVQAAIGKIESTRAQVVNPELRAWFLASRQEYYELQIDTLMALHTTRPQEGFAAAALEVSEQARARSLLEILQESEVAEGTTPSLFQREKRLREEVNSREWRRLELLGRKEPDAQALADAERRLEEAREEYRQFQDELRVSSPRYASLTQPRPLSESEIRAQLLDGQALLLEYKLGADRSFLWAVSPESTNSFELPGREEIEQLARRWYELLTVRNNRRPGEALPAHKARVRQADTEAVQVACQLSELILGPVEGLLGNRPLLVVADGALQYVPFAALPRPSTGSLLVERNEVVNLPSASALAALRRDHSGQPRAPKILAILADPVFQKNDERLTVPSIPAQGGPLASSNLTRGLWAPTNGRESGIDLSSFRRLPYSLKEAQTISSFAPKYQVFMATGFAATRSAATNPDLALYRNVHFATHGVLDSRRPELSGLVFSLYDEKGTRQDGFLRLNDIYNLHLEADLVVLSACRTALGKEIRGEGLVGLTRGFMYAGAARVLASLWSVEDRATAELMGDLYRGMLGEGLSPAAALRKAQIEMAKTPLWQSPYYWAGFSLQGEWR
jgi:CHAT domain-containing protein/tetratricopeptide (TPR) repeat protein